MDFDLRCNNIKCRLPLGKNEKACVTACSHIFCMSCANKAYSCALVCMACETALPGKDDIFCVDLNPSEDFKSSVLAGLRPETILDICSRGISFWVYQASQETEMIYKKLDEKCLNLEEKLKGLAIQANNEIKVLTEKNHFLKKEHEQERRKNQEINEKFSEKSRQLSKLQNLYDKLKRKTLMSKTVTNFDENEINSINSGLLNHNNNFKNCNIFQPSKASLNPRNKTNLIPNLSPRFSPLNSLTNSPTNFFKNSCGFD